MTGRQQLDSAGRFLVRADYAGGWAVHEDCCCDVGCACPADCASCCDEYLVSATSATYVGVVDRSYTKAGASCLWLATNDSIQCIDGVWVLQVSVFHAGDGMFYQFVYESAAACDCPPAEGWAWVGNGYPASPHGDPPTIGVARGKCA